MRLLFAIVIVRTRPMGGHHIEDVKVVTRGTKRVVSLLIWFPSFTTDGPTCSGLT